MKAKFPSYGVGDIAKELGKRWEKCTEKPRFEAMAAKDKKRYEAVSDFFCLFLFFRVSSKLKILN